MKQDNLYLAEDAREKIMAGVRKISEAVGRTMGGAGYNAVIETFQHPGMGTTNDGATIVDKIRLADPLEDMGRKILREAVSRANNASGDGSSTTCVLTSAILEEGFKCLGEASPMEIKRSLEACIPLVEQSLKAQKREISVDEVGAVAAIAAEDAQMGAMIQEIYQKIGKDGVIQWDVSRTAQDTYEIGKGITVDGMSCPAPFMFDRDPGTGYFTGAIRRKNPKILITDQKISTVHDLNLLGESVSKEGLREVVVICDEVERQAIEEAAAAWQEFKVIFLKMPVIWQDEWREDLALALGASIVGQGGTKLAKANISDCGTCENLTVGKDSTVFEGIRDMSAHISALEEDSIGNAKLPESEVEKNRLRASRLNVQTARYFVGGYSEQAIYHRRLKLEDAVSSAKCALESGIVPGGGIALMNILDRVSEMTIGGAILKKSLAYPCRRIIENAGGDFADFIHVAGTENGNTALGFDSKSGHIVDMLEANIVDAYEVTFNAVKNAVGVAATVLTLGSAILLPEAEATQRINP